MAAAIIPTKFVGKLLNKIPGKKKLGAYRFIPIFFMLGAVIEYLMINWHVGEVNFYNTYKKRRIQEAIEEKLREHVEETAQKKIMNWAFFRFCIAALISTVAGSQCVHLYYRPLENLPELIEKEIEKLGLKEGKQTKI